MKTHTTLGVDMLVGFDGISDKKFLQYADDICRHHHERIDGLGYPDGLVGDQIPIHVQIVSVADAYDALVSSRVYKPPFSHEKALDMIMCDECGVFSPTIKILMKKTEKTLKTFYE